jgi:hypothetical protein
MLITCHCRHISWCDHCAHAYLLLPHMHRPDIFKNRCFTETDVWARWWIAIWVSWSQTSISVVKNQRFNPPLSVGEYQLRITSIFPTHAPDALLQSAKYSLKNVGEYQWNIGSNIDYSKSRVCTLNFNLLVNTSSE